MRYLIACAVVLGLGGTSFADTIYVPEQYPTIQTAVTASSDGDVIIVSPGTYNEHVNINERSVELRSSDGSSVTSITAVSGANPITFTCPSSESGNYTSLIDGFTLNTTISSGCLIANYGVNLTVQNCVLTSCGSYANYLIDAQDGDNELVIDNCSFQTKLGWGGIRSYVSTTINNCTFSSCEYSDVSDEMVWLQGADQSSVSNCTFEQYYGWDYCIYSHQTDLVISNSIFRNNRTDLVISATGNSNTIQLQNVVIDTNISGGDPQWPDDPFVVFGDFDIIDSCVFANNISKSAALGLDTDDATVSNTTFCNNTPTDIMGNWINGGGNQFLATCGVFEGACCVKEECYEVEQFFCESVGGEWLGFNVTCEEDTCAPQPQYGACCINGEALPLYDYDCERVQGTFMGEGTDPNDVVCPEYCAGDLNLDGTVGVDDLLVVIANWGGCP